MWPGIDRLLSNRIVRLFEVREKMQIDHIPMSSMGVAPDLADLDAVLAKHFTLSMDGDLDNLTGADEMHAPPSENLPRTGIGSMTTPPLYTCRRELDRLPAAASSCKHLVLQLVDMGSSDDDLGAFLAKGELTIDPGNALATRPSKTAADVINAVAEYCDHPDWLQAPYTAHDYTTVRGGGSEPPSKRARANETEARATPSCMLVQNLQILRPGDIAGILSDAKADWPSPAPKFVVSAVVFEACGAVAHAFLAPDEVRNL